MRSCLSAFAAVSVMSVTLAAQQQQTPPPTTTTGAAQQQGQAQGRAGGGGRGNQTPEQREAAAKEAHDREAAVARPVPARDSVWIEELTYLEVRDAIKAGKTTALVMAGSTEQNGPYMSGGKHQYAIKLVGEAIARKLGNALIAPIIPIEAGNPENKYLEWGVDLLHPGNVPGCRSRHRHEPEEPGLQERRAARRQRRQYRRSAGGRCRARAQVGRRRAHLSRARVLQLDEPGGVRDFVINQLGIPEKQSEGIHDEYGLSAVMMAFDPKIIRFDERVFQQGDDQRHQPQPKDKTIENGKKIVEFRANVAVDAIRKLIKRSARCRRAPLPSSQRGPGARCRSRGRRNPRLGKWRLKPTDPGADLEQRHDL